MSHLTDLIKRLKAMTSEELRAFMRDKRILAPGWMPSPPAEDSVPDYPYFPRSGPTEDERYLIRQNMSAIRRLSDPTAPFTDADEKVMLAANRVFDRCGDCVPTEHELRETIRRLRGAR